MHQQDAVTMAKNRNPLRLYWGWAALAIGVALVPLGLAPLACGAGLAALVYMLWFAPMRCRMENRPDSRNGDDPHCRNRAYGLLNGCRGVPGHGQRKRQLLLREQPMPWWLWQSERAWAAVAGSVAALVEILWAGAVFAL